LFYCANALQNFCVHDCGIDCPLGQIQEMEVFIHNSHCYMEYSIVHEDFAQEHDGISENYNLICKKNNVVNLECENRCLNASTNLACSGDTVYCNDFNCSVNYDCYCSAIILNSTMYVSINDYLVTGEFAIRNVSLINNAEHVKHPLITSFLEDYFIRIITDTTPLECILVKDTFSELIPLSQSPYEERLTDIATQTSGTLDLKCYYQGSLVHVNSFWVYGINKCAMVDGFNYEAMYKNFKCAPNRYQFYFVLIHFGYVLIFLALCGGILAIFVKCFTCIVTPILVLLNFIKRKTTKSVKVTWDKIKEEDETSIQMDIAKAKAESLVERRSPNAAPSWQTDLETVQGAKKDNMGVYIMKNNRRKYLYMFAFIALMLPLAIANEVCDSVITLSTIENSCVIAGRNKTCDFKPNVQLIFNNVRETACMDIMNGDEHMGQLRIKYKELIASYNLVNQYFTCDHYLTSTNVHRCAGQGNCVDTKCEDMSPHQKDLYGETTNEFIIGYPGLASCRKACGCAACGCISCNHGCVFSAYSVLPKGPCGTIYKPSNLQWHQMLEISFRQNFGNLTTVAIMENGFVNLGGIQFSIVGLFQQTVYNFNEDYVLESGSYRLVRASRANFPEKRTIGDIQSVNAETMWSKSTTAFLYDSSSVITSWGSKSNTYSMESTGMQNAVFYPMLPLEREGEIWEINNMKLISNLTQSAKLVVNMKALITAQIVSEVNMICPIMEFVEIEGCYSCSRVSTMKVRVHSKCETGYCEMSCNGIELVQTHILFTKDVKEYHMAFRHGFDTVEASCTATCNGGMATIKVTGLLEKEVDLKEEMNGTLVSNGKEPTHRNTNDWFSSIFGAHTSWKSILFYIGLVLFSILAIFILVQMIKSGFAKKMISMSYNQTRSMFSKQKK